MSIFAKMIAGILAFLLWLFPGSLSLRTMYQKQIFNMQQSVSAVVNAVNAGDIAALEAMMCRNIKDNVEDLSSKIGELIGAVDGEIQAYRIESAGMFTENRRDGRQIYQRGFGVEFTIPSGDYLIAINWEVVCNFAQEETGIRYIILYSGSSYDPNTVKLAEIMATEGWGGWHD